MEPNIITLTDQYGESVRFELLDIVEYEDQEFAVLYPADGGDDEPVHILRITSENLDLDEMEFEGLDDEDLINAVFDLFCERNDLAEIIYVFLTIFLYLLKCPQSLILSALRAFCLCGKPHISRLIFLYFPCQSWLKSW